MPGRDPNAILHPMTSPSSSSPSSHSESESASDSRSRWSLSFPTSRHPSHGGISVPNWSPTNNDNNASIDDHSHPSSSSHYDADQNLPLGPPLIPSSRRPSYSTNSIGTFSDTFDGIRDDTALLSDMLLSPSAPPISFGSPGTRHSFSSSDRLPAPRGPPLIRSRPHPSSLQSPATALSFSDDEGDGGFESSGVLTPRPTRTGEATPRAISPNTASRSILTMLLARERVDSTASDTTLRGDSPQPDTLSSLPSPLPRTDSPPHIRIAESSLLSRDRRKVPDEEEASSLIAASHSPQANYGTSSTISPGNTPLPSYHRPRSDLGSPHSHIFNGVKTHLKAARYYGTPAALQAGVFATLHALPATTLGLLLNILDGVSYGFIMFPAGPIFAGFGSMGVSMFFLTTVVSQLVYSLGGSSFPGATSSMIIEVIPFFHIMAAEIIVQLGEDHPKQVIATTLVAFALSSILTGLAFLIFGLLRLGSVIGFFPRHILVGCIGGVGVFLIQTGLNVSAGLGEEEAELSWRMLKLYFTDSHVLLLWIPAFALAVLLRVITHKYHHQLIFPLYFVALPIIFYAIVFIARFDIDTLRSNGWVFNVGGSQEPWYKFYSYFDFRETSFRALWATMPTQLALLFFNVLHPPLNVPALAVSINKDDVDLNLELTGHGYSNLLAGFLGVPSNYLAYVNTLLFYRVGGTTRYSGVLLALATFALLLIGTGPIAFIPVLEVGALIFVLGIDLVKEAVWDTRHRASRSEYITILGIMFCMTLYDFVSGVLFGIILASIFFVIQNSRRQSIRKILSGATAMSTVRRPSAHRRYLQEVGSQTRIIRLQGHLFFGTITKVEETCRAFFDIATWEQNPIRFLVIDLAHVGGLDLSAAEAFVRVQRLLVSKSVILVFCGQPPDSDVAKALQAVDLWSGHAEVFANLNEALEWTENAYLRAWYTSPAQKQENVNHLPHKMSIQDIQGSTPFALGESFANSPRRNHIHTVGAKIMDVAAVRQDSLERKEQPFNTFVKTFSSHMELDEDFLARLVPYFKRVVVAAGEVVYRQGDQADGLFLIESGVLRATFVFSDQLDTIEESCVAGTLCGEMTALSGEPRNATVVAERQAILWKLGTDDLARMENENPTDARLFVKLVLKTSKIDQDVLMANLARFR